MFKSESGFSRVNIGEATLESTTSETQQKYTLKTTLKNSARCVLPSPDLPQIFQNAHYLPDFYHSLKYQKLESIEITLYKYVPFKLSSSLTIKWLDCYGHNHSLVLSIDTIQGSSPPTYALSISVKGKLHHHRHYRYDSLHRSTTQFITIPFSANSQNVLLNLSQTLSADSELEYRTITPAQLLPGLYSDSFFTDQSSPNRPAFNPEVTRIVYETMLNGETAHAEEFRPLYSEKISIMTLFSRASSPHEFLGWQLKSPTAHSLLFTKTNTQKTKKKSAKMTTRQSSSRKDILEISEQAKGPAHDQWKGLNRQNPGSNLRKEVFVPTFVYACSRAGALFTNGKSLPNTFIYPMTKVACFGLSQVLLSYWVKVSY